MFCFVSHSFLEKFCWKIPSWPSWGLSSRKKNKMVPTELGESKASERQQQEELPQQREVNGPARRGHGLGILVAVGI